MSGEDRGPSVTREELRAEIRREMDESRGPGHLLTRSEIRDIVAGEVRVALGNLVTRAELRQTVRDAAGNLKEIIPSKESVARADAKAGLALTGIVAVVVAIVGAAAYIARKGFFGE